MKKKLKLFLSISSLCFALAVLCFGVYSAQTVNYSLNGNVTYTVTDAFVEVQTKLYKNTTHLTSSQLGEKVNAVAEMDFATTPEGLTLVDTSEVYSSTSGVSGTYEKPNLKFSTKAGEECYAYFFVVNIKNLSPDINVWAVMEDELTNPANTIQINNGLQQTINQAGKNMVIGLTIDDYTQNITAENNTFKYGIKIGVGTYAMTEANLNKLTLTLDEASGGYSVKAKDTSVKGVVIIPESYTANTSTEVSNLARNVVLNETATPKNVTKIEDNAFKNCAGLTSIVIPSSVTSIGQQAFYGCTSLTELTIPDSVTSIGMVAFYRCYNLTSIKIPSGITSIETGTFAGCSGLTSITIPSNVTSIGQQAFQECTSLIRVTIPSNVTSMNKYAFLDCTGLTEVTIENGITTISYGAFRGCTNLTKVTIPSSVTNIDQQAFLDCTGLAEVTIPNSVTSIGIVAFRNCKALTSITIPSSVTSIGGGAFGRCVALSELILQSGATNIGEQAFYGCTSLTRLTIPSGVSVEKNAFVLCTALTEVTIQSGVTSIGIGIFSDCTALESIKVDSSNSVFESKGECLIEKESKKLVFGCKNSVIPTDGSVTSIGASAFAGCTGLTEITIPSTVTSIGNHAFDVTGLKSIVIPKSVTSLGYNTFSGNDDLESIVVEKENTVYTSRDLNGKEVNCLIKISSKTLIFGCKNSVIPADGSVTSIGSNAFERCKTLTLITIPDAVTNIGNEAFDSCTGLTSIIIPENVKTIGYEAFNGCTGITSVTIPSGVTTIGHDAFNNWTASQTIKVPFAEGSTPASGWDSNWKGSSSNATIEYQAA